MCAFLDQKATYDFVNEARKNGQEFIYGWKIVSRNGHAHFYGHKQTYSVGTFKLQLSDMAKYYIGKTSRTYDINSYQTVNEGFHFYMNEEDAVTYWRKACSTVDKIVRIKININDLIGVEEDTILRQGVSTKITFLEEDWKAAGLPTSTQRTE